jgi:hypothetical protein
MSKIGSNDPFGYLKHKLWPRESQVSICQFDLHPLKIKNRPNLVMCRWRATYCWKSLDEGYNFALDLTPIEALHKML